MNPYKPPVADVADPVSNELSIGRPFQVVLAVRLIAISLAVDVIAAALSPTPYAGFRSLSLYIFSLAVFIPFAIWLLCKIYTGRNWARMLLLILFVLGLLPYLLKEYRLVVLTAPLINRIAHVVGQAIDLFVLWLIFAPPGSTWYKRERRASAA